LRYNSPMLKRFLYLIILGAFISSCSTKRNTVVSRGYHNVTARYNGYYYAGLNIDEGVYKIEKNNKDNFEKILPVYIYPTNEKAKATFPEFDKAIKKSSYCIQRHAIKDKKGEVIPNSGKWIDNCWVYIGISQFYKREIFSGLESFEYVARTFQASKDKYSAMLWIAKVNNEIGSVTSAEQMISLLKNEKALPRKIRNELPIVQGDYYMRRGQNTEAATQLMAAVRNNNLFTGIAKSKRARYCFIIAQLYESQKEDKRAIQFYKKCIRLKPNYEMVFYSKIKMARLLDVKRTNSEKTKRELLKMSREFKNSDYYDVIYYTLGNIEEKEKNADRAEQYYKRSVQTSTANPTQKALSYLKLAEINFERAAYQPSGAYYDSAVVTLPKDHQDYKNIVARKKTLETLIRQIKIIRAEDSLQRIAKMSEADRDKFIAKVIADKEKEDERLKKLKESGTGANGALTNADPNNIANAANASGGASFYFYNPNTIAFGISEFTKKWGNRKYEENWRRSNKAMVIENNTDPTDKVVKIDTATAKDPAKVKAAYKKGLPMTDSLMKVSDTKVLDAYYLMGSIYKEELNNNKKATLTFEEMNARFPKNKYQLNTYYMLYRIYQGEKKADKEEEYKEKILTEYPESEFALLIKNPDHAKDMNAKMGEAESFYKELFTVYRSEDYNRSYELANEGVQKFGKNDFRPKFEFIRAVSYGKLRGVDSMEYGLKMLVAAYPKSEVAPLANDILLAIKKQKNPEMFGVVETKTLSADTFNIDFDSEHFFIVVLPDDPKIANAFKLNLNEFNTKYYSGKNFTINSNLFYEGKQLVILKSFVNAQEAIGYLENFNLDKNVIKGEVKKEMIDPFVILGTNLPFFYKKKNVEGYRKFFTDNYKKFLNSGQKQ
jgi:tetratricopeptide (TPR) repeat protein